MEDEQAQEVYSDLVKKYKRSMRPVRVNFRTLVPFASEQERATHLLHPYPAKLLRHIPALFTRVPELSKPGQLVLDPFCGSGTVLLEAVLAGRRAIGADANPLARLISRVKTSDVSPKAISRAQRRLSAILKQSHAAEPEFPDVVNISHWFYPHAIRKLALIKRAISTIRSVALREFFQVCFSQAVRRASLADPRISVPVRLRSNQYNKRHPFYEATQARLRALKRQDVVGDFFAIVEANQARVSRLRKMKPSGSSMVTGTDARRLTAAIDSYRRLRSGIVSLALTSPPYLGAQKYIRASGLSLNWLDFCDSNSLRQLEGTTVGREHFRKSEIVRSFRGPKRTTAQLRKTAKVNPLRAHIAATYIDEMRQALTEIHRVLATNGHLVLIIGPNTLCGAPFDTPSHILSLARAIGFRLRLHLLDTIRSRGLMTRRNQSAGLIKAESILVLEKT